MLAVGLLSAAVMTIPFWQNHAFYYAGDNPESFVPLWHHFGEQLRAGHWVTMDPAGWAGGNFAADGTYALWNPVQLLDYVLVSTFDDLAAAAALVQIQFLALLAMATYLLAREHGASRTPSVVLGVAVPAGGFTLFYEAAGWPAGLMAFVWVAWFWWAALRYRRRALPAIVPVAFGVLGMTTGNPYAALGMIVVLLGLSVELVAARDLRRFAGLVVVGLCVGASAVLVFLPLVAVLDVSTRQASAGIANDTFLVPHLGDLAVSSAPTYTPAILNWSGAVVERLPSTYFLWCAAPLLPWVRWRTLRRRGRHLLSLVVVSAVFVALTVAPSNLWQFRWPIRLIEYSYLGLGIGFAVLLSGGLATDRWRARAAGTVGVVAAGIYLSFATRPAPWRMHVLAGVLVLALLCVAALAYRWRGMLAFGTVLVAGTVLVVTYQTSRLPLGQHGPPNLPTSVSRVEASSSRYTGTVLQLATENGGVGTRGGASGELLFGNESWVSGRESVVRYTGMGYDKFFEALCMSYRGEVCPDAVTRAFAPMPGTDVPLVDGFRVSTVVIGNSLVPPEVRDSPPKGWVVSDSDQVRTVWTRTSALPYPGRVSVVTPGITVRSAVSTASRETVSLSAAQPGQITFARLAWPGYRATVDGRTVQTVAGPAGLLVVPVSEGAHTLVVDYRAPGVQGGAVALVGGLFVAVLLSLGELVGMLRRRRRRAGTPAPGPDAADAGAGDESTSRIPTDAAVRR